MPERFNFVALLEDGGDTHIRNRFVSHVSAELSDVFGSPREVMLLDSGTQDPFVRLEWSDSESLRNRRLSGTELLFIYFGVRVAGGGILSISQNHDSTAYNISFPDMTVTADESRLITNFVSFLAAALEIGVRCVVLGGGELEIDESVRSVTEAINSASMSGSLVQYLCCEKQDAPRTGKFATIYETAIGIVLKRQKW